ncbi:MAG: hypothetical protein BGO11_04710 [Solirubrobacterales bacterium 70-9]|nr:MAG: hypothetical protein BGO11_04710 [Solirubrobacterales bacterium 70-9]
MNARPSLRVGDVLNEVFALYRECFGVLIPTAFWLFLAASILAGIAGNSFVLAAIAGILALAIGTLYQGMVVSLVAAKRAGQAEPSVRELFASVSPVLPTLLITSVLAAIGVFAGFLFFIVPGCILLTIWAVIAPAVVIERRDVSGAFNRSQALVRDFGWPVFGATITAALIAGIAAIVLGSIGESIAGGPFLRIVFSALAATFAAPITALVAAVLYYRLLAIKGDTSGADTDPLMPPPLDPNR